MDTHSGASRHGVENDGKGNPRISLSTTGNSGHGRSLSFDTITFSALAKKETGVTDTFPSLLTAPPLDPYISTPTGPMSKTNSMVSILADDLQFGEQVAPCGPTGTPTNDPTGHVTSTIAVSSQIVSHVAISVDDDLGPKQEILMNENITQKSISSQEIPLISSGGGDTSFSNVGPPVLDEPEFAVSRIDRQSDFVSPLGIKFETVTGSSFGLHADSYMIQDGSVEPSSFSWIPSDGTRQIIESIGTIPATVYMDHITKPNVIMEDDLIDKVGVGVEKIFGVQEASRRRILTADIVTQNATGLRELIKLGCYRAAVNLTKRLLTSHGQGPRIRNVSQVCIHTPHTLQLWFTRISLLVRIREFTLAESELEAFKNFENADMYHDFYRDWKLPTRSGSLVPFYFRLLAAEVPQYMRKFNETINQLQCLFFQVQKILENLRKGLNEDGTHKKTIGEDERSRAIELWRKREIRVLYSLSNSSLFAKDYYNAFNFLIRLCEKDTEHLPQLKSAIGRLFLQYGDIGSAETFFHDAFELRSTDSEPEQIETLLDSALLAIAQSTYKEAIEFYKQALMIQPENFAVMNNLAVCYLYLGNVKEALALLETTVIQNLPQSLQENVLLNLCSIYELENTDGTKKLELLKLISEYKGDGINLASLKLPELV